MKTYNSTLVAVLCLTLFACAAPNGGEDPVVVTPPVVPPPVVQDLTRNPNVGALVQAPVALVAPVEMPVQAKAVAAVAAVTGGIGMNLVSNDDVVIGNIIGFYGPAGMGEAIISEQLGAKRYLTLRIIKTGLMPAARIYFDNLDCTGNSFVVSTYASTTINNSAEAPVQNNEIVYIVEHPYADPVLGSASGSGVKSMMLRSDMPDGSLGVAICTPYTSTTDMATVANMKFYPATPLGPLVRYQAPLKFVAQ
jgi:hypothetical protein